MNYDTLRRTTLAIVAIGCALMLPTSLRAQSTFGSIIGTVQDSSGAQMAGVAVKVRNLNDNSTRATLTDNSGEYQVLNLRPGPYEIVASMESFRSATVQSLTLESRQQLRADLKLELAEVTQEVNVEAAAGTVNTENGVIGDTKNFKQVVQLPMNYRGGADSPLTALVAVPGVQQDSGGNQSIGGGTPAQI